MRDDGELEKKAREILDNVDKVDLKSYNFKGDLDLKL